MDHPWVLMFQTGRSKRPEVGGPNMEKANGLKDKIWTEINLADKETGTGFKTTKTDLKFNHFLKLVTDHNCFSDSCLFTIDIH